MARKGRTTAVWDGNFLVINWYGIATDPDETGAVWDEARSVLRFEGLWESKGWKLRQKPTPDDALRLIADWQNAGS